MNVFFSSHLSLFSVYRVLVCEANTFEPNKTQPDRFVENDKEPQVETNMNGNHRLNALIHEICIVFPSIKLIYSPCNQLFERTMAWCALRHPFAPIKLKHTSFCGHKFGKLKSIRRRMKQEKIIYYAMSLVDRFAYIFSWVLILSAAPKFRSINFTVSILVFTLNWENGITKSHMDFLFFSCLFLYVWFFFLCCFMCSRRFENDALMAAHDNFSFLWLVLAAMTIVMWTKPAVILHHTLYVLTTPCTTHMNGEKIFYFFCCFFFLMDFSFASLDEINSI